MDLRGKLPHWSQDSTLQFLTLRLADSIPSYLIQEIKNLQTSFHHFHPKPWTKQEENEFRKILPNNMMKYMDKGYGECLLKYPKVRQIVEDSIMHNDGKIYDVISYVIMPNHIHLLLLFHHNISISETITKFKHFTTFKINQLLNRHAPLWQREYHDRMLRNETHLDYCLAYIAQNPKNLPQGTYSLYRNTTLLTKIK